MKYYEERKVGKMLEKKKKKKEDHQKIELIQQRNDKAENEGKEKGE